MTKKSFIKLLGLLLVVGLLFAAAPVGQAQAATTTVACTGTGDSALLQAAITGATDGDTISVTGTCVLDSNITVSKAVTLDGNSKAAKIQVSGTGYRITMTTAGATLKGFEIEKTDKTDGQNIIWINASNITIENNKVHGQFVIGDGEVARAIVISGGNSGLLITGNEFYGLRQPAYISGVTTGTISNNYTHGTKGWVVEQGDMTFTGNTWGAGTDANVFDIAILGTVGSEYYTNIPAMSAANNNAFIEDQRYSPARLTPVYVNASAPACTADCGTARAPYNKIQDGIDRVIPGGTVNVAAGTYDEENILITKGLTLQGAGATNTFIAPTAVTNNSTVVVQNPSGNVTISGFNFVMQPKPSYGSAVVVTGTGIAVDSVTVTISNNVVTGSNDGSKSDYGFYGQGNNAKIVITGNTINKTGDNPIVMEQQFGSSTVENNTFYITASPDYDAYYSMVHSGKTISTPQIVQNNVFHLDHSGSGYSQAISFTTAVLNAWGGQPNDSGHYTNIQIKDNTIYTEGPSARGIGLIDRSSVSGNGTITGAVVSGNKIIGEAAADAETYGITLRGDIQGADIQNNEISKVNLGFRVQKNLDSGLTLICSSDTDFSLNKVTSVTIAAQNTDCTGVTVDASPNWWGQATGPAAGQIVGNASYIPWCANAACTEFAGPVTNTTKHLGYTSIQAAINEAASGDVITVAAGTYAENVDVTKAVTLLGPNAGIPGNGTRVAEAVIQGTSATWVSLYVKPNVPGVVIDGFKFDGTNLTPDGYAVGVAGDSSHLTVKNNLFVNHNDMAIMTSGVYYDGGWKYDKWLTDILIKDNLITNTTLSTSGYNFGIYFQSSLGTVSGNVVTNMRNGIQVQPYWNTPGGGVVSGNTFEAYRTGIYFNYTQNTTADWKFTGNLIEGIAYPSGLTADKFNAILVQTFSAGQVDFNHNQVLLGASNAAEKHQYFEIDVTDGISSATPNWWGSILGPAAGSFSGTAAFDPWCGDAACSFLVSATEPAVSGFYVKDGKLILKGAINVTGGIVINEPLYIQLEDGTVIQNSSPCFIVNSSNVHIDTESIGGAKCVPTSGANGIDVAAGLNNITIEGIEFDGTGQTTGDGIHFAGAVTDIVLVDNYLHDLDGDGIEFAGDVAEIVNIQGNMFKNNTGYGINNLGATTVGAEYNSWGNVAGPAAGDGVNGLVTSTPFTHADLYVVSSGTPWANQVVKGQNITYTVKAHLENVNAADFVLTYPAQLTYVSDTPSSTMGTASVVHDGSAHTLHFIGYNTVNVTGDLPLFSVTFTGATAGANLPLSFSYAATSGFGMVGFESSTNVFVNEMVNGAVTIIDLPTISSTDIQGYYLTGEQRQFSVILDNPSTGADYAHVYVDFTIANAQVEQIDVIEYSVDNGTTWVALGTGPGTHIANSGSDVVGYFGKITGGGFPLASDDNLTTLFRVTFKTREQGATDFPNSYSISMSLKDADTADPDTELAAFTKTAYVYDKPTLTSTDIQGYYLVGEERAFHVQVVNPATGGSFTSIYYNFEIADAVSADIDSLVCGGQTISLSQSGTKLVGSTGPFPMPAGQSWNTPCSVKFNTAKNYAFTVYMTDSIPDPDRTLVTYTQTANVYTPPTLTSVDIVGPYLAGVPQDFHVTVNNPATGGSFVDSIYYVFTIANAELEDIYSLVCDGNSVTFTQSGSSLVGRTGYAGHGFPMPAGQEWITTCNVKFKNAGSYSFTVDMVDNPSGVIANDRILVSMSQTATVNSGFAITGTFSMQGNASRAGIPVTLTWAGTGWTYGPSANTTSAISNNFSLSVLYGGDYTITTLQPRYLNVYADTLFSKKIIVAGPYNMSALILKGGNAYWRVSDTVLDNTINTSDSSIVGTQYGSAGSDAGFGNHGDCNFDGTVNIQDLALVGGNWSLTSATAYTTWLP